MWKCEKMPASLECVCCCQITKVKASTENPKQDSCGIHFLQNLGKVRSDK